MNLENISLYEDISRVLKLSKFYTNFIKNKPVSNNEQSSAYKIFSKVEKVEISQDTIFGDSEWNVVSMDVSPVMRLKNYKINWDNYEYLPEVIIFKLKLVLQAALIKRSTFNSTSKDLAVTTIVTRMKNISKFINLCFKKIADDHGSPFAYQIQDISEIGYDYFQKAAKDFYYSLTNARGIAKSLEQKKVWKLLNESKPKFNFKDLPFPGSKPENTVKDSSRVRFLPTRLFEKLTLQASLEIVDFLKTLDIEPSCMQSNNFYEHQIKRGSFIKSSFDLYSHELGAFYSYRLRAYKEYRAKNNLVEQAQNQLQKYSFYSDKAFSSHTKVNLHLKRLGHEDVRQFHLNVQQSAIFIIWSYTGMRPGEFYRIKYPDSLRSKDGMSKISTNIKKNRKRTSLFNDDFLAIPIVVDAFNCICKLHEIYHVSTNYLSNLERYIGAVKMNEDMLITNQTKFMSRVLDNKYAELFYPYLYRHNLAYQLFRVDLGLPYISYALKHLVTSVDRFKDFSEVTLSYGDIGMQLTGSSKVTAFLMKQAGTESVESMFDPGGNYAGGGADIHKERLKEAVEPYLAAGYSHQEVFELMYENGYYLTNVGSTYCMANGLTEEFDDSLPCIGSLRCNPEECKNAVITSEFIPKWKEVYIDSFTVMKKVEQDVDDYSFKNNQLEEVRKVSSRVLKKLGVTDYA